jgi:hypothetical protein
MMTMNMRMIVTVVMRMMTLMMNDGYDEDAEKQTHACPVRVSILFLTNKRTKNNNQQRLTKCTTHSGTTNDAM